MTSIVLISAILCAVVICVGGDAEPVSERSDAIAEYQSKDNRQVGNAQNRDDSTLIPQPPGIPMSQLTENQEDGEAKPRPKRFLFRRRGRSRRRRRSRRSRLSRVWRKAIRKAKRTVKKAKRTFKKAKRTFKKAKRTVRRGFRRVGKAARRTARWGKKAARRTARWGKKAARRTARWGKKAARRTARWGKKAARRTARWGKKAARRTARWGKKATRRTKNWFKGISPREIFGRKGTRHAPYRYLNMTMGIACGHWYEMTDFVCHIDRTRPTPEKPLPPLIYVDIRKNVECPAGYDTTGRRCTFFEIMHPGQKITLWSHVRACKALDTPSVAHLPKMGFPDICLNFSIVPTRQMTQQDVDRCNVYGQTKLINGEKSNRTVCAPSPMDPDNCDETCRQFSEDDMFRNFTMDHIKLCNGRTTPLRPCYPEMSDIRTYYQNGTEQYTCGCPYRTGAASFSCDTSYCEDDSPASYSG